MLYFNVCITKKLLISQSTNTLYTHRGFKLLWIIRPLFRFRLRGAIKGNTRSHSNLLIMVNGCTLSHLTRHNKPRYWELQVKFSHIRRRFKYYPHIILHSGIKKKSDLTELYEMTTIYLLLPIVVNRSK